MAPSRDRVVGRGEQELEEDAHLVAAYGRANPEVYGGMRLDAEDVTGPVRLVAAFAGDLDGHRAALRSVVGHPDRVDVRSCTMSKADSDLLGDSVKERILSLLPGIGDLVVLASVWSGVVVLVRGDDIVRVKEVIGDEPWVQVEEGGYEPATE